MICATSRHKKIARYKALPASVGSQCTWVSEMGQVCRVQKSRETPLTDELGILESREGFVIGSEEEIMKTTWIRNGCGPQRGIGSV